MAERTRIGLIFSYDENWIAGAYYMLNIIHAINTGEDSLKPHIVLLSNKAENFNIVQTETNYPYLSYQKFPLKAKYSLFERVINKTCKILFNRRPIIKVPSPPKIEFLYPNEDKSIQIEGLKKINWIPDFQEEFLPHFFSEAKIQERKKHQRDVICNGDFVVFSSEDARSHFKKLYPNANAKQYVLHFAVTHPDFSNQRIELLRTKYKLPQNYFFAPNQFWAHKNHQIILDAVNELKNQGEEIVVAFSGKENDHRNVNYVDELKKFIYEHDMKENIKFLGFIERTEQLCIMKNAIAIVQPSLFEGWSTVVEDSKALAKHLVLSNITVHQEQIKNDVSFFNPHQSNELSDILRTLQLKHPKQRKSNYHQTINSFGKSFLQLINEAKIIQ